MKRPLFRQRQSLRATRAVLLFFLLGSVTISRVLPHRWGWENGVLENAQVMVLLAGFGFALYACMRRWRTRSAMLCLSVLPVWAILAARELSWGAVFLSPIEINAEGPMFSSRVLAYKPLVYPAVAFLLVCSAYVAVRFRVDRVLMRAIKQRSFPWFELLVLIVAMLGSSCAEGHMRCAVNLLSTREEIFEELVELVAYAALWLAQARVLDGPQRNSVL